jgi:hypothetical protein
MPSSIPIAILFAILLLGLGLRSLGTTRRF